LSYGRKHLCVLDLSKLSSKAKKPTTTTLVTMQLMKEQELAVSSSNSMTTFKRNKTKPVKPSKSFLLTTNNTSQRHKKIKGKIYFFGT